MKLRHLRFSLSSLLWFVVIVAITLAALVSPLGWWRTAFKATTLCCLFFAILAAIQRRGSRQSFWLGFAIVGWGYFALQQLPIESALPTTSLSWKIQEVVQPVKVVSGAVTNGNEIYACSEVVRWLWPMLLGFVGGIVARYLKESEPDVAP